MNEIAERENTDFQRLDNTNQEDSQTGLSASKQPAVSNLGTIDDYPWFQRMFGRTY